MIQRADQFNRKMLDFAIEVAPEKQNAFHRRIFLDAGRRLVLKTTVDQGTYDENGERIRNAEGAGQTRGGWQFTVGKPTEKDIERKDPSGRAALADASKATASIPRGGESWATNNKPWIEVLENGGYPNPPKNPGYGATGETKSVDGYSRQAPQGMLKRTVQEITAAFG